MYRKIIEEVKDKKIVILGFGKEGKSTYNFIKKYLPDKKITIMDSNYENISEAVDIDYDKLNDFDIIMKSPGISLKDYDFIDKDKIYSQVEYFLKYKNCLTIGVTGTKGKSTTTSLIYKILQEQKDKVYLAGNIGIPIFEYIDLLDNDSTVIIELSSHQLEYINYSPNIALILNLYEEHLDHYKNVDCYYQSKLNIAKFQESSDYLLYTTDNEMLDDYIKKTYIKSKKINITYDKKLNSNVYIDDYCVYNGNVLYNINDTRKLKGKHNLKNIMFALEVASILNLNLEKVRNSINNFEPLPHRMELVGTYDGVTYYNDSIATIPNSTINSIETFKNINTLIIGGKDRGIDYNDFIKYLNKSNIENIICLPDTGHNISKFINKKIYLVNDLKEAVIISKKITKKNNRCLLSPAAASYGFFKNFEERGNLFKEYVRNEEIK